MCIVEDHIWPMKQTLFQYFGISESAISFEPQNIFLAVKTTHLNVCVL